jgi:hypothetical protein
MPVHFFKSPKDGFPVIPGCHCQQSILVPAFELRMELDQIRMFQSLRNRREKSMINGKFDALFSQCKYTFERAKGGQKELSG